MILNSNYTWPAWVGQVAKSLTSFAVGYVYVMKDIPHVNWFSWDAVFMGLITSGAYHGGLADSLPTLGTQDKSPSK